MEELYWFTRVDSIHVLFSVFLALSVIFSVVAYIFYLFINPDFNSTSYSIYMSDVMDKKKKISQKFKLIGHRFALTSFIVGLIFVLVPTKQDMLLIYGVGGTLDYIQSNEQIQKLPDKVVNAIDIIIDKYTEDIIDTKIETDSLSNNK